MKASPFYAAFERDAVAWEQKLNQFQAILDAFVDVQRRCAQARPDSCCSSLFVFVPRSWVYLEGIFTNSTDVQIQLAYQYKKFNAFDKWVLAPLCAALAKRPNFVILLVEIS
jgi:hypothetical protein